MLRRELLKSLGAGALTVLAGACAPMSMIDTSNLTQTIEAPDYGGDRKYSEQARYT